jgi:hypothetical protein
MAHVETVWVREDFQGSSSLDKASARLSLEVLVDGMGCGMVTVCSGPKTDIDDLIAGNITLPELRQRWDERHEESLRVRQTNERIARRLAERRGR